jgi:hypothetical protein
MSMQNTEGSSDAAVAQGIVMAMLDGTDGHTLTQLHADISEAPPSRVDAAVARLEKAGVVRVDRQRVYASPALQCLDTLEMVCI